ncbi:MAG: hypothetical protein ACE5Z5_09560 [Candidatus Bathyarchaeia archaeon]
MSIVKPTFSRTPVTLKRPEFDLRKGLVKSPTLPWIPIAVDSVVARETVSGEAPVDGVEVVEWMHYAAADNAVFDAMAEEYNRLGSVLLSGSSDAYIPNRRVGDIRGVSVRGATVSRRGYGEVDTPQGRFRVPNGGKATFAKGDILAWGAIPWCRTVQWVLSLLQWRELARAPITDRVRFAGSDGLVAPNFFSVATRLPVPVATMRIGLTSNRSQTMALKGRGTKGSFEDVLFEDKFDVEAGESEVTYTVFGFPVAPAFTLELQPSDNTETILDYLDIIP